MPFKQVSINEQIIKKRKGDAEFDTAWQESRTEYKLLSELIKIRKDANLSQSDLAQKQVISNRFAPSLKA